MKERNVEFIEVKCCSDHIYMLVTITPHLDVLSFMGHLKGKSDIMMFDKHANLKY